MNNKPNIFVYGYGNPGRQDDGLGVSLSERVEQWIKEENLDSITVEYNYQLNIEDASEIADKELVIFVDASKEKVNDFLLTRVKPATVPEYTTHSVSPSYISYLCNIMYNKSPDIYLLHIKGYKWDFLGEMTDKAKSNLNKAYEFLKEFLINNEARLKNTY